MTRVTAALQEAATVAERPLPAIRVLGVDLSITSCGIALVSEVRGRRVLKFATTLKLGSELTRVWRRATIRNCIQIVRNTAGFEFDTLVMEKVLLFFGGQGGANMGGKSIEGITSLAATIEDWAYGEGVAVMEIAPATWRKAVLGTGRAKKEHAVAWVRDTFKKDLPVDAAEAACQACYGLKVRSDAVGVQK